ncbi:MAG: AMP-binding protein, partial [Desulfobacteraceae bacterium]|nr:AMP-binding protein [Desulfobacteraceae bacterium]
MKRNLQKLRLVKNAAIGVCAFAGWEISRGRLGKDIWAALTRRPHDIAWSDLLAECAAKAPNHVFLRYNEEAFSYRQMDQNANRTARLLLAAGGARGRGVGIFMRNSPRFLDIFFGAQRAGMYAVTINPELRGEGLAYIINHSDIDLLAVDAELLDAFDAVRQQLPRVTPEKVIVDDIEAEAAGYAIAQGMQVLSNAAGMSPQSPDIGYNPEDMCLIIYTSGTTGPPKGVVYRRNTTGVNQLRLLGHFLLRKDDVYYTYLSLSHGNALFVSTTTTMAARCTVALSRKFSASRFWENVRFYDATVFNTIGSIIPILMKQPEKSDDRHNNVRIVFSAACPADMWEAFEQRFGVTIYEGYGAIDGGGRGIMNLGT